MPPIVGVPALATCGCSIGPSSRICWPIPRRAQLADEERRAEDRRARNAVAAGHEHRDHERDLPTSSCVRPTTLRARRPGSPSRARRRRARRPRATMRSASAASAAAADVGHRRARPRRRSTRPPAPTPMSTSTPSSAGALARPRGARRRCARRARACRRAPRCAGPASRLRASARSAASIDVGFALYASLSTVTPSALDVQLQAPARRARRRRARRRPSSSVDAEHRGARPRARARRSAPGARRAAAP